MAINSREKGKRFEREIASRLREYGYTDVRRTAQYCGNTGDAADVTNLPYIHIEAKHVERLNIYDAMAQAKRDAENGGKGLFPAVFHKKNRHEILVTMRFDDFMEIYKEFEADMTMSEMSNKAARYRPAERCLICNSEIPEGRQICPTCERKEQE